MKCRDSDSRKNPYILAPTSVPVQAGDSLRVSNACEMVQISTRLSVLSPSMATVPETGRPAVGESKPLMERFLQWDASSENAYRNMCALIALQY
jgi:hypothetical protein